MKTMTQRERFLNALSRKPVDMLPCGDGLWGETRAKYVREGKLREDEDATAHFDMSWRTAGWLNSLADLDFKEVLIEETGETVLKLNGNGAQLRWWKDRSGTPEHVDFKVKERAAWESLIKQHLVKLDRRRIPFEGYRQQKKAAAEQQRVFGWAGVAPFEQMHPVCGHENMLVGMALDPDWVLDMVMTYADFTIRHLDVLFAEEGLPEFMWFYEDMGFKDKPFMSPAMYGDLVMPGHKKLFDYAHSKGLKVVVHSCGFVEPLVPGLVKAGMDCLQAMEVKAGMDMPRIARQFGDRISFCGNIDIRVLASNDRKAIDEELNRKILPVLGMGGGYILHSDHSIPPEVEHDTLAWFFDHGRRITQRMQ
ncbi:MAG: uroporphyrinogen decarboxylase family protein [Kiritimatiellia bacterium]